MPSSMPMTRIGSCLPRASMRSKRSVPTSGSRWRAQIVSDLWLDCSDPPRCERFDQQAAVDVVLWRIFEDDCARRNSAAQLDQLEDVAATRREGLPVRQPTVAIVEAGEQVEVVLLVVVQRMLFAKPLINRIGIERELEIVGIPKALGLRAYLCSFIGHVDRPLCSGLEVLRFVIAAPGTGRRPRRVRPR